MSNQARKYQITLNNPAAHGYSAKSIQETIASLNPQYFCMADEIGKEGTYHTHVFLYRKGAIRFDTLKRKFPFAHIEPAHGTCKENREYITKTGKWQDSEKSETSVEGTFFEHGVMPTTEEDSSLASKIIASVDAGKSTEEIIREDPSLWARSNDIAGLRETLLSAKQMAQNRNVTVVYIQGSVDSGRSEYISAQHKANEICRITNYGRDGTVRFDAYHAHKVLVFEEFNSAIPLTEMVNYVSGYPIYLPARYTDRVACYTNLYLTSSAPLESQYADAYGADAERRSAFLRCISKVVKFKADGEVVETILRAE